MKKIMIFAAVAALLSLSSCGKEEIKNAADASSNGSPVFTAGINPGTKTTVDTQYGKVTWETSDVITITDGSGNTATYYISGIDASTGKATFEYSSGDELGVGPYSAVYGTQPEKNQTYSATAPGKLYMTASSENNVLTFTVQCALMEINLTKEGESVKKIEVTGTPDGKEETTYTLTCTQAVSIAEQKSFYIALPAGTYTKIVITDSEDKVCTLNVKNQGIPVTVNQIVPATFAAEQLDFKVKGALPGEFSVSETKKVFFSQGNLWYGKVGEATEATFNFEVSQYDTKPANDGDWSTDHISHFYWSKDSNEAIKKEYNWDQEVSDVDVFFTNATTETAKSDFTVNGVTGKYRTLSKAEWQYLINKNNDENIRKGKYTYGVTVCGKANCVILAPDECLNGYSFVNTKNIYSTDEWATAEAAGLVCLPAAGCRDDSDVKFVGDGYYWSSTANGEYDAYNVISNDVNVVPNADSRCNGHSVRLVTDVK